MNTVKIICTLKANGEHVWHYIDNSPLIQEKKLSVKLDDKTAILEIKLHGLQIIDRKMEGNDLVVVYGEYAPKKKTNEDESLEIFLKNRIRFYREMWAITTPLIRINGAKIDQRAEYFQTALYSFERWINEFKNKKK